MNQEPANQTSSHGDVFVSYASQDVAVVDAIVASVEKNGIKCWIAPRDVTPGSQYADEIVGAINDAKLVILVLSEHAVASSHVGREIERAASKRRRIIALRTDAAALTRSFEYFLSESQWIDVAVLGMPGALAKLTQAVGQGLAPSLWVSPGLGVDARNPADRKRKPSHLTIRRVFAAAVFLAAAAIVVGVVVRYWPSKQGNAQAPAVAAISDKSIAVLPFADMSEKKDQEYFSDGIAEEVLDLLAKVPGIRVIGRTSSFQFKGRNADLRSIGTALGSAYVVEGSVRKSGERMRVTAQLVTSREGAHLWSDTYEAASGEVFVVQDRIAAAVVRALQVTIGADDLRSRPMKSAEAYDLYLRGRHDYDRFDKTGFENAAHYFQQALELEPTSVRAAEWLALTLESSAEWGFVPTREGFESARASTLRALALDSRSALAHANMCSIHTIYDWNWTDAARECQLALATEPHNPLALAAAGQALSAIHQMEKSTRLLTEALTIDPMVASSHVLLGNMQRGRGRLAEAEAEFRRALDISPQYVAGHYYLALTLLAQGKVDAARAEMQLEVADGGRDAGLAIIEYAKGNRAESDLDLARVPEDWGYWIAAAHAYRGEIDQAIGWLNRAYSEKDVDLAFIKTEPIFEQLKIDPRYKAFLKKMNLPE
jgi:TolB-like protein/Flp pilus assembly protein TadD